MDSSAEQPDTTPKIHTYHCLCNNLLLASTRTISSLATRSGGSEDHALILPSPPVPRRLLSSSEPEEDSDSESEQRDSSGGTTFEDVTVSISLPRAAHPIMIRRSDGYEKRWLLRCGRCRLVVGYQLDSAQFEHAPGEGRREDVMYILPGALRSTDEMVEGKKVNDKDVEFGVET